MSRSNKYWRLFLNECGVRIRDETVEQEVTERVLLCVDSNRMPNLGVAVNVVELEAYQTFDEGAFVVHLMTYHWHLKWGLELKDEGIDVIKRRRVRFR